MLNGAAPAAQRAICSQFTIVYADGTVHRTSVTDMAGGDPEIGPFASSRT
ncbi:MAG: hypothetical protein ACR2H0_02885 [Candidatus Limnocylindrales bacterium]